MRFFSLSNKVSVGERERPGPRIHARHASTERWNRPGEIGNDDEEVIRKREFSRTCKCDVRDNGCDIFHWQTETILWYGMSTQQISS